MKIFLFSRRFLLPLFIVWLLLLIYVEWQAWELWKDDFKDKGIPSSVISRWLLLHIGPLLTLSFISSFLLAIVFYSHYNVRKEKFVSSKFFSKWNLLLVILVSLMAFLYTSFIESKNEVKSMTLLREIVWAKPGEKFDENSPEVKSRSADFRKPPGTMNINELFHARDSMRTAEKNNKGFDLRDYIYVNKELRTVEYLINKKFALPFVVILFYFLGIFLGASFYKIHVIVPLLVGYFILLTGWYYFQRVFEWLYRRQDIGTFLGANGATIIFAILGFAWFFVLRKYGLLNNKEKEEQSDQSSIFNID